MDHSLKDILELLVLVTSNIHGFFGSSCHYGSESERWLLQIKRDLEAGLGFTLYSYLAVNSRIHLLPHFTPLKTVAH